MCCIGVSQLLTRQLQIISQKQSLLNNRIGANPCRFCANSMSFLLMRKRVHNCITIVVGRMGHMQQTDRLQIRHTTPTHMCDLHRLRLEVSGAIWQGWLAVWDEEHIQAGV
jgi:hypothetical protein